MHWVLIAVLAVVLVASASRFPKLSFSLLVVLIAAAAGFYYMDDQVSGGLPESLEPSQVAVRNVTMVPYYAGAFRANGEIVNQSPDHDLTELVIRFSVEDCPETDSTAEECEHVSYQEQRVRVHVPPGATRSFEQPVSPPRTDVSGKRRWTFKVVDVTGRRPLRATND